ncbi:MAG: hypothetical protein ABIK41_05385 [candidate division WOR-3 bacterium]
MYPTQGHQTVDSAFNNLNDIIQDNHSARGLLIIFHGVSQDMILNNLQPRREQNQWFNFLIMENNNNILSEELENWLSL